MGWLNYLEIRKLRSGCYCDCNYIQTLISAYNLARPSIEQKISPHGPLIRSSPYWYTSFSKYDAPNMLL